MYLTVFFRPGFNCQSEANISLVIEKYTSKSAIYLQVDKKQTGDQCDTGGRGVYK